MKCFVDTDTLNVCPRRRVLDVRPFRQALLDRGHELSGTAQEAGRIYLFTCAFNRPQRDSSLAAIADQAARFG